MMSSDISHVCHESSWAKSWRSGALMLFGTRTGRAHVVRDSYRECLGVIAGALLSSRRFVFQERSEGCGGMPNKYTS